jgi:thiosulfate dehydrogenase (quinone) large subunit
VQVLTILQPFTDHRPIAGAEHVMMTTKVRAAAPIRPDVNRARSRRRRPPSPVETWTMLPWSIRVLRAFLGVTFVFAGVQKLFDPNFLHAGSPDYIGTQLRGFGQGTPAAPLMHLLARSPVLTGIAIALVEIAVGLGTLLGVGMLAAAAVGLLINLVLWLSATWSVHPYFLGSDSIYAIAWLAFGFGLIEADRARRGGMVAGPLERIDGLGRREFVRGGLVAGAAVLLATAADVLAGAPSVGARGLRGRSSGSSSSAQGSFDGPVAGGTPSSSSPAAVRGKVLTTLDALPIGKAVGFSAPGVGAAVLVRLANDRVVAYSRICTHAGCLVGYDSSSRILVCPCHGAQFDPAQHAAPIAGPAPTPLQAIRVEVDRATGQVILPG